jgi:hypothetical protein
VISLAENIELLEKILEELKEIKHWIRLSGLPVFRRAAQENLRDEESRIVYELSDGNRSTREIAEELKKMNKTLTHATVANMWKRWAILGIVEPSERYQGRFKKVTPLEALGIETAENKKTGEQIP